MGGKHRLTRLSSQTCPPPTGLRKKAKTCETHTSLELTKKRRASRPRDVPTLEPPVKLPFQKWRTKGGVLSGIVATMVFPARVALAAAESKHWSVCCTEQGRSPQYTRPPCNQRTDRRGTIRKGEAVHKYMKIMLKNTAKARWATSA